MWKIWLMFDPRRVLVVLAISLFALALLIHVLVLATPRFNWITGQPKIAAAAPAPAAPPAPAVAVAAPTPAPPAVVADCQSKVDAVIKGAVVRFEASKSVVAADSTGLLDGVAAALKPCQGVVVEVAGHTDATGAPAANMALSQARAQAVLDYLVKQGVPADRLTAKGYGSTRPIDPASNREAWAKNRRIEFTVAAAKS